MRICLLDPGLFGLAGHHFDVDLRLVRALTHRGHDVTVHGFVSPTPELMAAIDAAGMRFYPTFHVQTYYVPSETASPMEAYRNVIRTTAADLAGVPQADLWFWPTLVPYQFMAAREQRRPIPQLGGVWGLWYRWADAAREVAEAEAQAQAPIVIGAYDELLCQVYRTLCPGLPIVALPCPHDGAPNDRQPTALRRIGFFGHQRTSRGLDFLPELVREFLDRGFEVVVQDSGSAITRKGESPRLAVLPFVSDLPANIALCDLVIWHSRVEVYLRAYSGIVSECIATGVPVVLPTGCLPADVAGRFGAGVFFHEYSKEAILEAVHRAQQDYPAVAARARAAATKWHAENGTDRLAGWITEKFGGST